jgi:hypothetical protein
MLAGSALNALLALRLPSSLAAVTTRRYEICQARSPLFTLPSFASSAVKLFPPCRSCTSHHAAHAHSKRHSTASLGPCRTSSTTTLKPRPARLPSRRLPRSYLEVKPPNAVLLKISAPNLSSSISPHPSPRSRRPSRPTASALPVTGSRRASWLLGSRETSLPRRRS